jgi:hypothetical protein
VFVAPESSEFCGIIEEGKYLVLMCYTLSNLLVMTSCERASPELTGASSEDTRGHDRSSRPSFHLHPNDEAGRDAATLLGQPRSNPLTGHVNYRAR